MAALISMQKVFLNGDFIDKDSAKISIFDRGFIFGDGIYVCITLYGFIAVSGLKMIQKVDLENNANLFTTAVILITGIGGMSLAIGKVTLTTTACALILGIITNILVNLKKDAE